MKKQILLFGSLLVTAGSFAQSLAPNGANILYGRNAANNVSPLSLGLGLNNPYSVLQVHSNSGDNHVVVSGAAPSIRLQGPSTALAGTPSSFGVPYAKIALSTGPNNYVDGSVSGDLILQTVDNTKSIIFSNKFTAPNGNGIEQMRLNSSGFLGIGTAAPETKLHVRTGDISIDRNRSMIFGATLTRDGNGEFIRNCYDILNDNGANVYSLGFFAGYQERMRINYDNGFIGMGTNAPRTRVEIKDGSPNQSGLTFTNLTSASPGATNASGKVLSVNALGKVILVNAGTTGAGNASNGLQVNNNVTQLGRECDQDGDLSADLLNNRAIPLNNYNLIFKEKRNEAYESPANRVGIGYFTECKLAAKLHVEKQETDVIEDASIGILSHNSDAMTYHIIDERVYDQTIAVKGIADAPTGNYNIGGDFIAKTNAYGIGVSGTVEGSDQTVATAGMFNVPMAQTATGVFSNVFGLNYAIGMQSHANSANGAAIGGQFSACGGTTNFGIYASACNSNPTDGNSFAGFFDGDVFTTGQVYSSSDKRIKKNIESITNALDLIKKIEPKKYQFDNTKYPALNLSTQKENYGVIAQELETVLPSLVKEVPVPGEHGFTTNDKIKSVNYTELIPILIQAVKDQQVQIEDLKAIIATKDFVNGNVPQAETINPINVTLSGKNTMSLGQNVPNPFDHNTAIAFNIPEEVRQASINFTTTDGKLMKSLVVEQRGKGVINLTAEELSSGLYIYTLVADGKIVESRKMQVK